MRRHGIVPAAEAPAVDFPRIDVEKFSQVPLEERWQLMAGALNRLAAIEEGDIVNLADNLADMERRLTRLAAEVVKLCGAVAAVELAVDAASVRMMVRPPPEVAPADEPR